MNKTKKKPAKRVMKLSEEQYIHRMLQDKKTSAKHKMELFRRLQEILRDRKRESSGVATITLPVVTQSNDRLQKILTKPVQDVSVSQSDSQNVQG